MNIDSVLTKTKTPKVQTHLGVSQWNTVINLDGTTSKKELTYLDSTATALADKHINQEIHSFLEKGYANTHTTGHHRGRDSTEAVHAARDSIGRFVGYDSKQDLVIFQGNGATGPLNYLAHILFPPSLRLLNNEHITVESKENIMQTLSPKKRRIAEEMMQKPIVITTEMDHHSNQLPWFDTNHVKIVPVNPITGELDLDVLKDLLQEYKGQIRLVSIPGASNVSGIINPIYDIAQMAHEAGAEICIDAAQLAPHYHLQKRRSNQNENLDYIILAPHKFGTPSTPGVLIANKSLLNGRRNLVNLGGGVVNTVTAFPPKFTPINELDAGEEPGTPNIAGIIAVGLAANHLSRSMPQLISHERQLTQSLLEKVKRFGDEIRIIGVADAHKRVGVVSIIVKDVPHAIVTAFLNDSWNIAVRNGCFCAHPYIIKMSGVTDSQIEILSQGDRSNLPGYVRLSFGEHNTKQDVNTVISALTELVENKQKILDNYHIDQDGNAIRIDGFKQSKSWSFEEAVKRNEVAEHMQSLGFNDDEISSFLPIFYGNTLLERIPKHKDSKDIIKAVQTAVHNHEIIPEAHKILVTSELLIKIYSNPSIETGGYTANIRKQPIFRTEDGVIHTAKGWKESIQSMLDVHYPQIQNAII